MQKLRQFIDRIGSIKDWIRSKFPRREESSGKMVSDEGANLSIELEANHLSSGHYRPVFLIVFILIVITPIVIVAMPKILYVPPNPVFSFILLVARLVLGLVDVVLVYGFRHSLWYWLRDRFPIKHTLNKPDPQPLILWFAFAIASVGLAVSAVPDAAPVVQPNELAQATETIPLVLSEQPGKPESPAIEPSTDTDVIVTVSPSPSASPTAATDTPTNTPTPTAAEEPASPVIGTHNVDQYKVDDLGDMQGGDEGDDIHSIVWSPDKERPMFATVSNARVMVWAIESSDARVKWRWPDRLKEGCDEPFGSSSSSSIAWLHGGKDLAVGLVMNQITILDTSQDVQDCSGRQVHLADPEQLITESNVMSMAWAQIQSEPSKGILYVGPGTGEDSSNWFGRIAMLNLESDYSSEVSVGYPQKKHNHNSWVIHLASCVEDNGGVYVASVPIGQPDDSVKTWGDLELRKNIPTLNIATSVTWHRTPDKKCDLLAVGTASGGVEFHQNRTGTVQPSIEYFSATRKTCRTTTPTMTGPTIAQGHCGAIRDLEWSPDGNLLATGSSDGKLLIWDWKTRKAIWAYAPTSLEEAGAISAVAFSPDGRYLAFGTTNQEVYFLKVVK